MRFTNLAIAWTLISMSSAAIAGDPNFCQSFIGKAVETSDFDTIANKMATVPAFKDEFETTQEFKLRQDNAKIGWPTDFVIGYRPNREYLKFDADRGGLIVSPYFFRNLNTSYSDVFGAFDSPFYGKVKYGYSYNIDIVVEETEAAAGSYSASNAYGASARVSKIKRSTKAVWEGEAQYREKIFPAEAGGTEASLGFLEMPAQQAKLFKGGAMAALGHVDKSFQP